MTNKEQAQKVVDRILDLIKDGNPLPWVKPWNNNTYTVTVVDGYKTVTVTPSAWNRRGVPYKGCNTYLPKGEYITFAQCKKEGGKVKKGAKGFPVVYWNFFRKEETDPETGDKVVKTIPFLKGFTVFNVNDCEGIEQKHSPKPYTVTIPITHTETIDGDEIPETLDESAETIVSDYVARAGNGFHIIRDKESREAFYVPSADYVKVPRRGQFDSIAEYYSTLFHELGHSTGHATRLNRFTGSAASAPFGSQDYSREELVAETTAATILNAIGMEDGNSFRNSAAYIQSWASHIKNDPLMYVTATTKAQMAVDMILGIEQPKEDDNGEE